MNSIDSFDHCIYWDMPSPKAFLRDLISLLDTSSVCWLHVSPQIESSNIKVALEHALVLAHSESIHFKITANDDVLSVLGRWSDKDYLTMQSLGGDGLPTLKLLFLEPECQPSLSECLRFAQEIHSVGGRIGFRVIVLDRLQYGNAHGHSIPSLNFNGSLQNQELSAYLLIRFSDIGVEDESGFYRLLIEEFCKFDPFFCEELLLENKESLLNEPMKLLKGKMEEKTLLCSAPTWKNGMISGPSGDSPHILHYVYLAEHASAEKQQKAKKVLEQRMWRAATKSLLPWIEEKRHLIVEAFQIELEDRSDTSGEIEYGPEDSKFGRRKRHWTSTEFGTLIAYVKYEGLGCHSDFQKMVFDLACKVKAVRDQISHFECPSYSEIWNMFEAAKEAERTLGLGV